MIVQFPAKFCCGTAERQTLPLILCWGCTFAHAHYIKCKAQQCARQ
jgi:hypothetical protein